MKILSRRWWVTAVASLAVAASAVGATTAFAGANTTPPKAGGLGQKTGLLPRNQRWLTIQDPRVPAIAGVRGSSTRRP
jgi:hypothetical protein